MKIKKLIIPIIAVGLILLPSAVKAAGQTSGASNPFYGGTNTYGYSWAGCDDKQCYTTTLIGGNSWSEDDLHWAQTEGCYAPGRWDIYENHSFE